MTGTLTRLSRASRHAPVLPLQAPALKTHLDTFEVGDGFVFLSGWVVTDKDSRIVEPLSIAVDGETFSPIPVEFRADFESAGIAEGQAGFMVGLPVRIGKTLPRMVIFDATGASAELNNSNFRVKRFAPRGAVDNVEAEGVTGWIFDPALMISGDKATLTVDGGPPHDLSLSFDRSDVPYTFIGHPRQFGFHFDASEAIKAAAQSGAGLTSKRKFTFELFGLDDKVCSHGEVITLGASAAPAVAAPDVPAAIAPVVRPHRPRMLVVSWDMGHNPAGRAYLLADIARRDFDVKLIGPLFKQYGSKLWEPLEGQTAVEIETFPGGALSSYLATIVEQVERNPADIVYVSKPRLPSLIFGLLMRARHGATIIVDVDDHELSFYKDDKPLSLDAALRAARANPADADMPYANVWTQLSEELVKLAGGVTVSNIALQERFGGLIVRHARDEDVFSIDERRRQEVRKEFGLTEADRAIVFVGTPRPHKGIYRIAEALERLGDERLVFVMIGSFTDASTRNQIAKYKKARIKCFDNQPWERLPELVAMADAVAILQDPKSRVSEYQIPAKLTDALALGRPVLATRVAPFADLFDKNAMLPVDSDADLDRLLKELAASPEAFADRARRGRAQFLSEFSYAVNAARLNLAAREARAADAAQPDHQIGRALERIFKYAAVDYPYPDFGGAVSAPAIRRAERPRDLVFFWKQNDSDLYGRRSDMLVKYLVKSGKIRRVIHFDRSLTLGELEATIDRGPHAPLHQGNLIYLNSMRRIFKMSDRGSVVRRTFLCRNGSVPQTFLGMDLPPRAAYVDFVKDTLKECGVDAPPLAWVCPVVFDFPKIHENVPFERVIADVIDDQRKWQGKTDYMNKVAQNYVDVLKVADLVLANCEPVRKGFSDLRDDVVIVPNGTEVFPEDRTWPVPEDLAGLPRPIIGYVGNLRDRIDFELIRKTALAHPEWTIVLVGSAHGVIDVHTLSEIPNIRLMGVRPYDEALNYIKNFDVAMMPHISNELTENMNPLKLYVYFALGVPVVTTEVANIGDIAPHVAVASTHAEFITATENLLQGKTKRIEAAAREKVLKQVSWPARVDDILECLAL
jgi:glycosyltransferase involved in cell wall biosynthesis